MFFVYVMHPRRWPLVSWVLHQLHKLRDYNRLREDYRDVLNYASLGEIDDVDMDIEDVILVVEYAQLSFYHSVIKSDIQDIGSHPEADLDYVMEYVGRW